MDPTRLYDDALGVLLGDGLADVVDLVLLARGGIVEAHARDGSVGFHGSGRVAWRRGRDPLAQRDPGAFATLDEELVNRRPANHHNHYPYAYDNVAQLFDDPRAPDLAVVHTPAHNWEERGGHRGEHGSPDVVQSRAPLIMAGAGIRRMGRIDRAARMVDVGPTLAVLAGVEPSSAGEQLRGQQGRVLEEVLDPAERPEHVVAVLCDGTNANVLYAMADAGELPAFAGLMAEGTTFGHGCIASFPSVTLANHTTALTGLHPGAHGVLHNFYFDRRTQRRIVTNAPERWHLARDEIAGSAETVFEAVAARGGRGFTAAVNEPVDRGASSATFDLLRTGAIGLDAFAASPDPAIPGATQRFADLKREYAFSSIADNLAVRQMRDLWGGSAGNPRPRFQWINLILPDAANHAGGPYSDIGHAGLRDTDRRLGQMLEQLDPTHSRTAVVVLADHGMEESDPDCKGDWDEALAAAGIPFRDEGYGFVYLGDEETRT